MPVRPAVCGSPAPMTAAQVEAQRANAVHMTNTRVETFAAIRETTSWALTDAGDILKCLSSPLVRHRYPAEIADVQELQKQLETFKRGTSVTESQTEQLPSTHKLVNGCVVTVPGGQRILSEKLFFDVNGTRLTAQEALQQVEQLAGEVKLIAADHNVPLSPR